MQFSISHPPTKSHYSSISDCPEPQGSKPGVLCWLGQSFTPPSALFMPFYPPCCLCRRWDFHTTFQPPEGSGSPFPWFRVAPLHVLSKINISSLFTYLMAPHWPWPMTYRTQRSRTCSLWLSCLQSPTWLLPVNIVIHEAAVSGEKCWGRIFKGNAKECVSSGPWADSINVLHLVGVSWPLGLENVWSQCCKRFHLSLKLCRSG